MTKPASDFYVESILQSINADYSETVEELRGIVYALLSERRDLKNQLKRANKRNEIHSP